MLASGLRLAGKLLRANLGSLDLPYKMTFVVTKGCRSRCAHCGIWTSAPQRELGLDEIRAFARNSPFLSWIDFTGGEPTDRDDLPEVVAAFLRGCPDLIFVRVPTNGLDPDRVVEAARRIRALRPPVFVVSVSVDGPSGINDALRGAAGDFEKAVETLRRLKELGGIRLSAAMTLHPENAAAVRETVAAIQARVPWFRIRDLHINLPQVSSHYYGNEQDGDPLSGDRPAELSRVMREIIRLRGFPLDPLALLERRYQAGALEYLRTRRTPRRCEAMGSSFYLSERGELYPCSVWDRPLGSIRDCGYSLLPLWRAERSERLRRALKAGECPNCWTPCDAYPALAAGLLRGRS